MQMTLDFGASRQLLDVKRRLADRFGPAEVGPARTPIGQLVKSLISSRTYDAVSLHAYEQLVATFSWSEIAAAPADRIEAPIAAVQFADIKARHLGEALRRVEAEHPGFDLEFLGKLSDADALAWLERLPGVGRKVAASVLNFSTLNRKAFVIDTHVLRILRRLGMVGPRATTAAAYDRVMGAVAGWSAVELAELHVQMKRLGQRVCRPQRPRCGTCPLMGDCGAPAQPPTATAEADHRAGVRGRRPKGAATTASTTTDPGQYSAESHHRRSFIEGPRAARARPAAQLDLAAVRNALKRGGAPELWAPFVHW
jgi:endonuclease III